MKTTYAISRSAAYRLGHLEGGDRIFCERILGPSLLPTCSAMLVVDHKLHVISHWLDELSRLKTSAQCPYWTNMVAVITMAKQLIEIGRFQCIKKTVSAPDDEQLLWSELVDMYNTNVIVCCDKLGRPGDTRLRDIVAFDIV